MSDSGSGMIASILDDTTRHGPGSAGLLVLRLGVAGMMLLGHGSDKLFGFSEKAGVFPDPLGIGSAASLGLSTFAEFFCAIALVLGFATRFAAVPLVINMLVITLVIHGGDPWSKKEFALLYAVPFITLLFTGGGKYSLDAIVWPRVFGK